MGELSPVFLISFLFLLLLCGLFLTLWLVFRLLRSPGKTLSLRVLSAENNESVFVAETYQTVVSQLQTRERKLADLHALVEQRAVFAENLNSRIISSLPSGLIAFEGSGRLRLANSFAAQMLEISADEDCSFREVLEKIPALAAMVEKTLEEKTIFRRETVLFPRTAKTPLQLGVTIAPLGSENGEPNGGAICLLTDLTEVNELRQQLELKQNLASLGEMAAGLTHEFKNSLAAAQSYAQFLHGSETDSKRKKAAEALLNEVRNLSKTVTSFLDFARPQPLNFSIVKLNHLFQECLSELNQIFQEKEITVRVEGNFLNVSGDEEMLRRVFLNLLRNSSEALESCACERRITVTSSAFLDAGNRNWNIITIADNGKGISPEHLPFVFIPFYTTKTQGHGIGLALSHRIITEHGGSLTADNSPDGGAVFTIKLPLSV